MLSVVARTLGETLLKQTDPSNVKKNDGIAKFSQTPIAGCSRSQCETFISVTVTGLFLEK